MFMEFEERERRQKIQAPLIQSDPPDRPDEGAEAKIQIKAQPQNSMDQLKLMLNRELLPEHSWVFQNPEDAKDSPTAQALLELDGICSVQVDGSTLLLYREIPFYSLDEWKPLAKEAGQTLRQHFESGLPLVPPAALEAIPPSEEIHSKATAVIEEEINPGIAAHSGVITLNRVEGNRIFLLMGGGCQGCSAASVTLRMGIHRTFHERIPGIGAIYDETDHAAGENPFFS
tara:strand:- start:208 stop:897 length:690 start_codon:yes stop_codon:yes gene_type:complete